MMQCLIKLPSYESWKNCQICIIWAYHSCQIPPVELINQTQHDWCCFSSLFHYPINSSLFHESQWQLSQQEYDNKDVYLLHFSLCLFQFHLVVWRLCYLYYKFTFFNCCVYIFPLALNYSKDEENEIGVLFGYCAALFYT